MKFYKHCILGFAMAALLALCSDDKGQGNEPVLPEVGEAVYMGLTVQMPTANGGRSQTEEPGASNDGVEVGTDDENKVAEVAIVIAKKNDNSYIVSGLVTSDLVSIPADNSYKTTAKLQKTNLNDYYTKEGFSQDVNIFVFCNPTADLKNIINSATLGSSDWYSSICTVNDAIWKPGNFLMSNFAIASRKMPATIDAWNSHKTAATAFDFSGLNNGGQSTEVDNSAANGAGSNNGGAVLVHRSMARFDFADGSNNDNTYDVVKTNGDDNKELTLIQVQLGKMAVANLAKEFYYLHRVSDNGQLAGSTLLGAETATNYIVGPYATDFAAGVTTGFDTYFTQPFYNNNGSYSTNNWGTPTLISDVLGGKADNWTSALDYKPWRYIPENVIPGEASNQQTGISTTVIFKGKMIATEAALQSSDEDIKAMAEAINNVNGKLIGNPSIDPILYSFNGNLYLTWNQVKKAAIAASIDMTTTNNTIIVDKDGNITNNIHRSNPLYVAVFGNGGMGTFTWGSNTYTDNAMEVDEASANTAWTTWDGNKNDTNLANMRAKVTGAGFTIYQSSTDDEMGGAGYYCNYFYYNRHNDNNMPGVMGPMEFGVVRNNVYKLAVTKISGLGHPRIPENDPDKPKPDDPDESDDIYFTVTCRTLPWVVRVNNIEF